jgi:hypothetical protein
MALPMMASVAERETAMAHAIFILALTTPLPVMIWTAIKRAERIERRTAK